MWDEVCTDETGQGCSSIGMMRFIDAAQFKHKYGVDRQDPEDSSDEFYEATPSDSRLNNVKHQHKLNCRLKELNVFQRHELDYYQKCIEAAPGGKELFKETESMYQHCLAECIHEQFENDKRRANGEDTHLWDWEPHDHESLYTKAGLRAQQQLPESSNSSK